MEQIGRTAKQIGAAVRRQRKALGLTQADLGSEVLVRQATISELENGNGNVRIGTLVRLLGTLGLELIIRPRSRSIRSYKEIF